MSISREQRRAGTTRSWRTILLLCGALIAFGGGAAFSVAGRAAGTPPPATPATAGCGRAATPGSTTLTLTSGGHSRTLIVHIPTGYVATQATPLVLNLHGSQSTAAQQEVFTGMDVTADADTFIVAYPQAAIPSGAGFDWNIPGAPLIGGAPVPAGAADDIVFLKDVVSTLEGRYCVAANRVYATGMSGGGRMASQLGCDASGIFAAVAPVAGLRFPAPCASSRPVPVIAFHGTADPVDPYNGNGQPYWTYSVPVAAQRWAAHDGCAPTPTTTKPNAGATLTAYGGCRGGAAVELYTLAGEGHEWPGGPHMPRAITRALGPQTTAVNANDAMWAFFVAHPLP